MKKTYILIFILIIIIFNIVFMALNIFSFHKKYTSIDNKMVSFNILDDYFMKDSYSEDTNKFKLYSEDKVSSIDVIVLDQYSSNKTMYSYDEITLSIFYQMLGDLSKYNQDSYLSTNDDIYSIYSKDNKKYSFYVKYYSSSVLVVLYISDISNYDNNLLANFIENVKVKNEKD